MSPFSHGVAHIQYSRSVSTRLWGNAFTEKRTQTKENTWTKASDQDCVFKVRGPVPEGRQAHSPVQTSIEYGGHTLNSKKKGLQVLRKKRMQTDVINQCRVLTNDCNQTTCRDESTGKRSEYLAYIVEIYCLLSDVLHCTRVSL